MYGYDFHKLMDKFFKRAAIFTTIFVISIFVIQINIEDGMFAAAISMFGGLGVLLLIILTNGGYSFVKTYWRAQRIIKLTIPIANAYGAVITKRQNDDIDNSITLFYALQDNSYVAVPVYSGGVGNFYTHLKDGGDSDTVGLSTVLKKVVGE